MKTIFISSTFRDMQFERDILNKRMLPSINEIADKYGDSITLCDLRWGINTNEMDELSSNKKILDACLNEIDSCRPYMIVFIGDRYGWIPGEDLMKYTVENHSLLELDDYNISVTELEILYGTFFNPSQFERTLFYFRNIEGSVPDYYLETYNENCTKLNKLKERIKLNTKAKVYDYNIKWNDKDKKWEGYDFLSDKITKDIENLMKDEWIESDKLSNYDKEIKINFEYVISNSNHFYKRHTNIDLINYLLDNKVNLLAVNGTGGIGTTMLLSKLVLDRQIRGSFVLPIFCGLTKNSTNDIEVIKHILEFLHRICFGNEYNSNYNEFNLSIDDCKLMLVEMYNLIRKEYSDKKIIIIIDSVELLDYETIFQLPFCLHAIPDNITYILGTSSTIFFDRRFPHISTVKSLDYFDANSIIKSQLAHTRKELDDVVIKEIFKKKHSKIPLYIELMIRRLSLMEKDDFDEISLKGGNIKAIIDHQINVVRSCEETIEELGSMVISVAGAKINQILSNYVVLYISASKYGISEKSLINIFNRKGLEWNTLDFKILMQYLNGFFFKDDEGNYRIKHQLLKNLYNMDSADIYDDLIEELDYKLKDKKLLYTDINEYINYCFFGRKYRNYVKFLFDNNNVKNDIARATFDAIRNKFIKIFSDFEKEDLLVEFINGIFKNTQTEEEKETLFNFFITELKNACDNISSFWRIMAYAILGDWDKVNYYYYLDKSYSTKCASEINEDEEDKYSIYLLYEDCERINDKIYELLSKRDKENNKENNNKLMLRKEHLISPELRKNEIKVGDNLYYFFDVPTKEDCNLYFMCNEYVILTFYRSSVGDHCTYDVNYDGETLIVKEADFSHYDRETDITTYVFLTPKTDKINYKILKDTERGAINLPIYFKIK